MSLRVYYGDSNPEVDPFAFRQSNARAQELVTTSQGRYITLRDGRQAVQLYRYRAQREAQRPWIETQGGTGQPMSFLRFVLPESAKQIMRNSLVPNVRTFASLA